MRTARPAFLPLWTLAVMATVAAFVVHLALRGRTVQLGYELGRARQEQAHLREVRRVLELESASYKTPERVEIVARTLLGMEPPPPERIVALPQLPQTASNDTPASAPAPKSGPATAVGSTPAPAATLAAAPVAGLNGATP